MAKPELRAMLGNSGVDLIFQPPYSPDFNPCEFCFRNMKMKYVMTMNIDLEKDQYLI